MSGIKKWNGSAFEDIRPKKWNGSVWENVDWKKFNGSAWENLTSQQHTMTWTSNWTQTYRESGTKRTDYRSDKICQGEYVSDPWGIMRSLIGFDDASMRAELAGATINKVELFLHNEHWYYVSGGTAIIGYHNHDLEPATYSSSVESQKSQKFTSRGQSLWVTMPNALGEGIRDNRYKGVTVFANSQNMEYYGIFSGAYDGANAPKLKITYTK